jgi:hypothetical protein
MTNFDDAKRAVESLFGQIQGYKAISFAYDAFVDGGQFETGDNYVFVGRIYTSADHGNSNIIYVSLWNGKFLTINNSNGGNDNHLVFNDVIAKDNKITSRPAVDLSSCQQPEAVTIIGWQFQINK